MVGAAGLVYGFVLYFHSDEIVKFWVFLIDSSTETRKNRERSFMELTEQVERIKEMVPRFTEVDGEGVPMEWKQQVERIKETVPCFTEEMICKMHEQCKIDSDPGFV